MIVLANNFAQLHDNDVNANNPLIGYHNLVTLDTVSADNEQAGYPVTNVANPATFLEWRGADYTDQHITVDTSGYLGTIDYLAVAKHNFGSGNIAVSVDINSGAGFSQVTTPVVPDDDSPIIFRFAPASLSAVRLLMNPGDLEPRVSVMYVGKMLTLQRRIYRDHTPLPLGRTAAIVTGRSESGNFLGRIMLGESNASSVALQNITPAWYRTYLDPFIVNAKTLPFFFAWRPDTYPLEVGYAWLSNEPKPSNQRSNGMMQVSLDMTGIVA